MIVYTAIFDNYDTLPPCQFPDTPHVCFTDKPQGVEGWEERKVDRRFVSGKQEMERYLALSHLWFPDAATTIFHAGHGQLLKPPSALVELLGSRDVASFDHPTRDCIYEEAKAVLRYGKAQPIAVEEQMEMYRRDGYPPHNGLAATGLVIRRNTPEVARFNEMWWALMNVYTLRDQLSFDYALWKCWMRRATIPGGKNNIDRVGPNDYIRLWGHNTTRKE